MVTRFTLEKLFDEKELTNLVQNFGFKRMETAEIEHLIQSAFSDYILSALSELGVNQADHQRIYVEATHYLDKASKLLDGMPHPAGKMAYRLMNMKNTLEKVSSGQDNFATDRASRFMEKNLVRRLRDIWIGNTSTPFHSGGDGTGRNPRDFILTCFASAYAHYPDIAWFNEVNPHIADILIKSIKR